MTKQEQLEQFCKDRDSDGVLQAALERLLEIDEISFASFLPYWSSCGETLGTLPDIPDDDDE